MKGNMKSDLIKKIIILSVLILIPIGILYLNLGDELFNIEENMENRPYRPTMSRSGDMTRSSGGSINKRASSGGPEPDTSAPGSKFVNICHPKKPNFYNLNVGALEEVSSKENISASTCKYECDTGDCDLYLMNENVCKLYKKNPSADMDSTFVEVNCNNKVLPSSDPSNPGGPTYTWMGEGKIDSRFYKEHKNNFKHVDYLLNKANDIKEDYIKINTEINDLKKNPDKPDRTKLRGLYDVVNLKLKNTADYLDLSRNSLYSNFVDNKYSMQETEQINLGGKDLTKIEMLKEFKDQKEETRNIDGRGVHDSLVQNRGYLIYMILCILMVISVVILIIFKMSPDLISDKTVIGYFIGVLLLLFVLQYYFKV